MSDVRILHGDCVELMRSMPENSVDAIVTDPPYGLEFMGKEWDKLGWQSGGGFSKPGIGDRPTEWVSYSSTSRYGAANPTCALCGGRARGKKRCECEQPEWKPIGKRRNPENEGLPNDVTGGGMARQMSAMQDWHQAWAAEALRVLKPGGHLLSFGGTRTYHRMACAIEDAGFEIRDSIHWVYGSGFPKSLNVSKAIDKSARTERSSDAPATNDALRWDGWGTALKPSHEPIIVARKPLVGTVAKNVLQHGVGALNIDGCRVSIAEGDEPKAGHRTATFGTQETVSGGDGSGEWKAAEGRWPANFVMTHAADCVQVGFADDNYAINRTEEWSGFGQKERPDYSGSEVKGQRAVWNCVPECPMAVMDGQSGVSKDGVAVKRNGVSSNGVTGWGKAPVGTPDAGGYGGSGGASRFFNHANWSESDTSFIYVAKPSKKERNAGLDGLASKPIGDAASPISNRKCKKCGLVKFAQPHCTCAKPDWEDAKNTSSPNHHPTVKPVALMRHLVRMVTPPDGTVLDPFSGSGTTLVAAILEGVNAIGCEMTDEYLPIIEGRVAWAQARVSEQEDRPSVSEVQTQLQL